MKKGMNKKVRNMAISVSGVLIILFSILFFMELLVPKYLSTKEKLFTYASKGSITYKVGLKPNILYSVTELGEGGTYISAFVDSVNARFHYDFSARKACGITGFYDIIAMVEGSENSEKGFGGAEANESAETQGKVIWRKQYVIVPTTKIENKGKTQSIDKEVLLKYDDYNNFVQKVAELTKLSTPARLVIQMNIDLKADTEFGTVADKVSQSLTFPLSKNSFIITKSELPEKPGAIEKLRKNLMPVSRMRLVLYGAGILGSITALLLILFLTCKNPEPGEKEKMLKKIFLSYGNRMAALNGPFNDDPGHCRTVRSMDDLVRIADEIQKPILYGYDSDRSAISKFFTCDVNWIYLFDMCEFITDSQDAADRIDRLLSGGSGREAGKSVEA